MTSTDPDTDASDTDPSDTGVSDPSDDFDASDALAASDASDALAASDADLSPEAVDCLCGAAGVLDLVSRKYAIPVLCVLHARGTARFGDFEDLLSTASTSTLSARLDELVDAGLATRTQYDEIPPRVEYELTDDGRELGERLGPLVEWAAERDG